MECIITNKKTIVIIVLLVISIILSAAFATYYLVDYLQYRATEAVGNDAQVVPSEPVSNTDEPAAEPLVPIDFDKLSAVNDDIYAWIRIPYKNQPGEYIADYPVVQSPFNDDQEYYLTHNINRKQSAYGAIYTQSYNTRDFSDFNTVIYGHNMRAGSMFGTLRKYRDAAFFKENSEILVYQPDRVLKYRIFAAYVYDDRHILKSFNNNNALDREQYLEEIFSNRSLAANIDHSIEVGTDDYIITLSTCTSKDTERYLVQGVLVYDSSTNAQ